MTKRQPRAQYQRRVFIQIMERLQPFLGALREAEAALKLDSRRLGLGRALLRVAISNLKRYWQRATNLSQLLAAGRISRADFDSAKKLLASEMTIVPFKVVGVRAKVKARGLPGSGKR